MRQMGTQPCGASRTLVAGMRPTRYPYLLRNLSIEPPNHVWATGTTYIPMYRGFVYLVAIADLYSRRVHA